MVRSPTHFMVHQLMSHKSTIIGEIAVGGRVSRNHMQDLAGTHVAQCAANQHQRLRTRQPAGIQAIVNVLDLRAHPCLAAMLAGQWPPCMAVPVALRAIFGSLT